MKAFVSAGERPLEALETLVSPYGVVAGCIPRPGLRGGDQLHIRVATAGSGRAGRGLTGEPIGGSGRSLGDAERARLIAVAEAAERYSAYAPDGGYRWSRAHELDGDVIDLDSVPRCSAQEYAHPDCPLVPFDETALIRWTPGEELVSGRSMWVPAVMANYALEGCTPAEHFTYRISTGHAVHFDRHEALVGGILEVVERDAVAITWLQRLSLPRLSYEITSDDLAYLVDAAERHFIEPLLYDATTDLGVPTVYCRLRMPYDRQCHQVVGCATDRTLTTAAEKALAETLSVLTALRLGAAPGSVDEISTLMDGARYMASADRADAFSFLDGRRQQGTVPPRRCLPSDPRKALADLCGIFRERQMQIIVVDRTTRELAEVGLTSVSVVIPQLQPMSLLPAAQFKGHPRLYEAPRSMGHRVLAEGDLNPWPQPFA